MYWRKKKLTHDINFYVLTKRIDISGDPNAQYVGEWCDAEEVDRINGEADKCPQCGRYISMKKWEEPRKIRLSNTKYPDRLTTWLTEPLVVSERVVCAFKDAHLTGINTFSKVEVVKVARNTKRRLPPPNYYVAELNFSQVVTVNAKRTITRGQKRDWKCPTCSPLGSTCSSLERLSLDTSQWDGTDIFSLYFHGHIICSQKFYDLVKENAFTNFDLVPVEDYKWPWSGNRETSGQAMYNYLAKRNL